MSQRNNTPAEEPGGAPRRFRLPKLFADSAEDTLPQELMESVTRDVPEETSTREYSPTSSLLPPVLKAAKKEDDVPLTTRASSSEYSPRSEDLTISPYEASSEREENTPNEAQRFAAQLAAQPMTAAAPVPGAAYAAVLLQEMEQMREDMNGIAHLMTEIREHGTAQDKIFDTLHAELQGYKNDFIYEHLKPVVRSLLFLYDSLEQFDSEMLVFEQAYPNERREFSPSLVRENVIFFRSQLVESLRICEVVPMEEPEGFLDPRLHKAIDVVAVGPELDRVVLRLVRSGWFLNGRVFRPAEVIVGRCEEENGDATWNAGAATTGSENDHATA
jgi:molecular chaperone GrpE (heat shock protein)